MSPELLTVDEAAERLRISRRSLYRLIETAQIPTVSALTPAGARRVRADDLDAYIAARTGTANAEQESA